MVPKWISLFNKKSEVQPRRFDDATPILLGINVNFNFVNDHNLCSLDFSLKMCTLHQFIYFDNRFGLRQL